MFIAKIKSIIAIILLYIGAFLEGIKKHKNPFKYAKKYLDDFSI